MHVVEIPQHDRRLGRHVHHDERSRGFALGVLIDRATWRDRSVRIYDPTPNPNQCHFECTGCAEMMMLNQAGNRVPGRVLNLLTDAHKVYSEATNTDTFPGTWPPDDSGSSCVEAAKAAIHQGYALDFRWEFGGADGVVQNIVNGRAMVIGSRWDYNMFTPDADNRIHLGGGQAGGHAYLARGYWKSRDWVKLRCWWGAYRDVWIARADLDDLLRDSGDAHFTRTVNA